MSQGCCKDDGCGVGLRAIVFEGRRRGGGKRGAGEEERRERKDGGDWNTRRIMELRGDSFD